MAAVIRLARFLAKSIVVVGNSLRDYSNSILDGHTVSAVNVAATMNWPAQQKRQYNIERMPQALESSAIVLTEAAISVAKEREPKLESETS